MGCSETHNPHSMEAGRVDGRGTKKLQAGEAHDVTPCAGRASVVTHAPTADTCAQAYELGLKRFARSRKQDSSCGA